MQFGFEVRLKAQIPWRLVKVYLKRNCVSVVPACVEEFLVFNWHPQRHQHPQHLRPPHTGIHPEPNPKPDQKWTEKENEEKEKEGEKRTEKEHEEKEKEKERKRNEQGKRIE